ncbi:uncharacterized protein B4U80_09148 [Leptotrombidium deliense]|uniref:PEHE domain-containing protein n=1 Tax=Leptotrombidium deliense TaxID=299467 RepID=A0A443S7J9_9ACAR|nr:uncharacterized protein B4U80_09148 [Leptotrombidium deliense]
MNSHVNGSNENAVNVLTHGARVNGAQLTPTIMGLSNNSSVRDGISQKVLLLKQSKTENGQTLLLSFSPAINSSVNTKHDTFNNSKNKNVNLTSNQLSNDDLPPKFNVGKKETKSETVNKISLKMDALKKKSAPKEGNYKVQQQCIETRTQSLMKRIKRLQAKQIQKHVDKQLKGFVRCEQSGNGVCCQYMTESKSDEKSNNFPSIAVEDQIDLSSSDVKRLSTKALVNLVNRIKSSGDSSFASTSCSSMTSFPQFQAEPQQVIQSPSTNEACGTSSVADSLPTTNESVCENAISREEAEELRSSCCTLKNNMQHLEGSYDSDATESSSGGESCDELDESYKETHFTGSNSSIPVDKRPTGKWFIERGAIASRWTWLQAQVADLEFKIRQQNEMYRQLRANKGTITFCRDNPTLDASDKNKEQNETETLHCVRTVPLKQMRRRKLVRASSALSGATRKIARHSNVQCICNSLPHFVSPCVLCNGRFGYVQVIDTDCMPHYERIALLDSSCHSVLSLPNDVALGLHFSKFLKKETLQQPVNRHQYKKYVVLFIEWFNNRFNRRKGSQAADLAYKFGVDGRKSKKSQAIISSSKLRKKYDGSVKRKYSKNSCGDQGFPKRPKFRDGHEHSNGSGDSRHDSPLSPFTADLGNSAPLNRRRRSEQQHAFDINNIVIPYSIASSTRVEKLQYKEILTPKWRAIDLEEESSSVDISSEDLIEDLTDSAFADRHERCEAEERKRFGCVLKTGRGRLQRSRLDSSRSDTISNCVNNNNVAGDSNMDSSSQDSFASNSANLTPASSTIAEVIHGTPARTTDRHRTSSSSKRDDSIDEENYVEVPPFEKRRFPLSDCVYNELLKETFDESECDVKEIKELKSPKTERSRPVTPRSSSSSIAENDAETDDNTADPEWEPKVE